ncbi:MULTISPECIES: RelA/SpoT family protein [Flavobacteriaceae]|uniref:Bifunctional (P)ppGpp synthetase/guanosine-3',5'-bis(Diphosphate) 3'-pyrophosphohydrolase n=2 Tax=Flavobacteriaceae TaxID=49546 RepID=A0A4Y8AWD1_9FLAO|nr:MULTISPECIES: RelA/SpoT family protein [Flavobacteriaceae]TEW76801.1 bifunctional (p)ppGpp synthetase/guanosine-3',5'-bis(diphosphate) 3'-pyrophosphohydrolase [Gramella jeungdoensis]GGK49872.1 RelA/SpoT family protein [Lutibacter litoralis]
MTYNLSQEEENKEIAKRYKDLLKGAYQTFTDTDKKEIRKAFDIALEAHSSQRRKTGEPYIFHPIAVAKIVAYEIGLDTTSIVAALLHDVVEDTDYTLEDIERLFGENVARIVNGLTKISHLKKDQDASVQAENFRKMLLTLNDDVRVILIKIADRLHNMQTMDAMPHDKQIKISSETLYIYAPLAHRLGLYNIKSELENLGLKYTEPDVYIDIANKVTQSKEEQKIYIDTFTDIIKESLDQEGFEYTIKGRRKSIYSIRKKMLSQGVTYDEIYDKFAIRIIYKSTVKQEKFDAWKIYSIVTDHFRPNPSRLRDWISQPKSTGYESLHITVMGPKGKWVEVQIRSERMDEIAEKGYAAHYKYKNQSERETGLDDWLNKIKESLENPDGNAIDFVEDFKLNLYAKEIFIFTPNGDLKALPKHATALDFAFSIHTQVGMNCRGAKINGKLKPISQELFSGDQVEIITAKNQKPNIGWLDFVVTARARTRIKNALKEDQKKIAEEGKEVLTRKLKHLKITLNEKVVNELVVYFKLKTSLDLFYRMGSGAIDNTQLKDFISKRNNAFVSFFKNRIRRSSSKQENIDKDEVIANYDSLVFGAEEERLEYKMSQCCNPIPGDKVFGFITINDGIKVHKKDCPNAISLQANYAYRILSAKWIDSTNQEFKAILRLYGVDHVGMVNEITEVISRNMTVNIHNLNISGNDGIFEGSITVSVKNKSQLQKLSDSIKKIEGIDKVDRIYKH